MSELRILLLGLPSLEVDGAPRGIKRRKVTALLAYLAMASRTYSRDELAELFYPRKGRDRAYAGLRQSLSYLKAAIGDGVWEAGSQALSPIRGHGVFLDVTEFRSRISRAHGARELDHLRSAVELYRGAFLEDFFLRDSPAFEEWQSGQAEKLRGECAAVLIRLQDLYMQQGSFDPAVECARSIVALDRLDEPAQRRLMRALAAAGRKRDALRQFDAFRALLARELDAEPEEESQALLAELRSGSPGRPAGWRTRGQPKEAIVVGVLPFGNLSEDPAQAYFCDGLTEDLTTALAAIPQLKVAACNTMFGYKGQSPDARQLGSDLGVTHILEGSVLKAGTRIRLNAQLIETGQGSHIWAKKFDKELSDIFQVHDDIVRSIVTELEVRLADGEQARLWRATTANSEAYDLFLQARYTAVNPEGFRLAAELLDRALALDPHFVAALCYQGIVSLLQAQLGWDRDPLNALQQASSAFGNALRLDDRCADAHAGRGALLFLQKRFEEAGKAYEAALSLGPSMEATHLCYAAFCTWKKEFLKALWAVRRAKELSRFPHSQTYAWEIVTLRNLGRLHEALAVSRQALELFPDGLDIIINHANVCRLLELREELAVALKRILELQPDFTAERWVASTGIFNEEEKARYVAELHRAGFP